MMFYYTYKITFVDGCYYYGYRVTKKRPEEDVYWGSPKTHKDKWMEVMYSKTIIECYDSKQEAFNAENILIGDGHKTDPLCLNAHNNKNFTGSVGWRGEKPEEWKEMMRERMIGKNVGKKRTPEQMKNRPSMKGENNPRYGVILLEETREKIRQKAIGRKQSQETIEKRTKGQNGKKWWVNINEETLFQVECPGEEWKRGRKWR
jgi:hypothetical protein